MLVKISSSRQKGVEKGFREVSYEDCGGLKMRGTRFHKNFTIFLHKCDIAVL